MKQFPIVLSGIFLSAEYRQRIERVVLVIAISTFLLHLLLIGLVVAGFVDSDPNSLLHGDPVSALYTPFSFILVYEVYLLLYYLPHSLTTYINKQYEIILLIIMRRLFKDFANLQISSDWLTSKYDLQFTYDLVTTLLLFFLIYLFSTQSIRRTAKGQTDSGHLPVGTATYARIKGFIASGLVPVVFAMAIYSLVRWLLGVFAPANGSSETFQGLNNIFFQEFFTLLVIVDVVLLLVSFFYTDEFHTIIRNSGFIISTILIRMSFNVEGVMNNILVVAAVLFGLAIQMIYNKYESRPSESLP